MSEALKVGDDVEVNDAGLAMLRLICPDMPPNHHGRISRILEHYVEVEFPIGGSYEHSQVSIYEPSEVKRR